MAIFCLEFSRFLRYIFLREGRKRREGEGAAGNSIPQRQSHIFQDYNTLSAVPSLHWEMHSCSTVEKRSVVKISQELHHCPRGTCSSGGESRASRSVDRNPHHKTYYWGKVGKGDPWPDRAMTSFCWIIFPRLAGYLWSRRAWTDGCFAEQNVKAGERQQGGCDLKCWKNLCPRGKLTPSLYKGRYNSVTLPIMDLPELAQTNCSSQGQWQSQNRGRFLMWSKVHHCNNNSGSWIQKETG